MQAIAMQPGTGVRGENPYCYTHRPLEKTGPTITCTCQVQQHIPGFFHQSNFPHLDMMELWNSPYS